MDLFNAIVRSALGGFASLFGTAHPLVGLTVISVVTGAAMLWVFGLTSDQTAILAAKKKVQAYLLELRLYGDDPRLIWRSQKSLLAANLRYIALMMKPAMILTIPMMIMLVHMDNYYGKRPLAADETAVVTVQVSGELGAGDAAPLLTAPAGISVETPAVRAVESGQISWRVRATGEVRDSLRFSWKNSQWEKTIDAGTGLRTISGRRVASLLDSTIEPGEDRLRAPGVEWVEVSYPLITIALGGLDLHWLIWFLVISMVSAFALKGYFGVVI